MDYNQALHTIGLKSEEASIYQACLQLGSASILDLSKATKIPRATIYLIIDSLITKSLITQTVSGKRKQYLAAAPQKLIDLANQQHQLTSEAVISLTNSLPELQALYNTNVSKPKVRYYQGVEDIKHIYEDTLNYNKIYVHCMTQNGPQIMGDYLYTYFKRVLRRQITTYELVSDSSLDQEYQAKYSTENNHILCIPQKYTTNTDYMIYGDNIAFITYKGGQPIGVVIQDPELAKFEILRFNIIYQAAKTSNL